MRIKLLMALFAVLATAALGMGPAAASATTVTFTDNSGNPLKVGSTILGASNYTNIVTSAATFYCKTPIKFSGKLTANNAEHATVEMSSAIPAFNCDASGQGELIWEVINAKASPIKFSGDENGEFPLVDLDYNEYYKGSPGAKCQGDTSSSNWGKEKSMHWWNGTAEFSFYHPLAFTGPGCASLASISGYFQLTDAKGQPIKITKK